MCGIAGILGGDAAAPVAEMTATLRHRGPDWQATATLPGAQLGAARLRIVDLSPGGDQPLVSARGGAVLVFNGEIYNYRALRDRLTGRGHRFATSGDTEVVLRAYEEYGWRCVEHLRGMYAFAVVDGPRALLARDPLGIKPLHTCTLPDGRLAFASEVKALLRCPQVPARIDLGSLGDLRAFEYIADSRATLFDGIRSLEPGHCLEIDLAGDGLRIRDHAFAAPADPLDPPPTVAEAEARLDELLDAAVGSHRLADVPICLTLSGGLDSTLLGLLLARQVGAGVVSYAAGDDPTHVDVVQAERMARALGVEHRPLLLDFDQYLAAMPASVAAAESFTDGVPQYLLFREIGRQYRVALNGEGADELLGGYQEHWSAARFVERIRSAPASLPASERGALERQRLQAEPRLDTDAWMYAMLLGPQLADRHLHPLDKLSMASSVEVRVPFLDHDVVDYLRRLPPTLRLNRALGSTKYLLRRVYLRRWRASGGDPALIDAVLREKRGLPDARRASAARFYGLCQRVLPADWFAAHPRRDFLDHAAQAVWFDLFEHLFCTHRGTVPDGFDVLDFLAQRAGVSPAAVLAAKESSPPRP
jgi:asparagine synthase (glutamine-hydrolysing)